MTTKEISLETAIGDLVHQYRHTLGRSTPITVLKLYHTVYNDDVNTITSNGNWWTLTEAESNTKRWGLNDIDDIGLTAPLDRIAKLHPLEMEEWANILRSLADKIDEKAGAK